MDFVVDPWYTVCMKSPLPLSFRPLLWSFRWSEINIHEDKEDIIMNTINEGTMRQWHWLVKTYGKDVVGNVLKKRLQSEFHPESFNLAKVIFSLPPLSHARRNTR